MTRIRRLAVIGIDSMDPKVLSRHLDQLPTLKEISNVGFLRQIKSVFPPDSIPAWATIYTGKDPSEHGLILTPDVFESSWKSILSMDINCIRGKTFWDNASRLGRRVFVWFPLGAYPPWEVNGTMISRSFDGRTRSYPDNALPLEFISSCPPVEGRYPGKRNLLRFADRITKVAANEMAAAADMAKRSDWDLAFFFFSPLDIIQHFFWRYYDHSDPTFIDNSVLGRTIPDAYKLIDTWIGKFRAENPDTAMLIISDHGHGMRPPTVVNVNEILRKKGLLVPSGRPPYIRTRIMECAKRLILETTFALEKEEWLISVSRASSSLTEKSKETYVSERNIDFEKSAAHLSSFAGPKSYPTGGVSINPRASDEQKEETCRQVIEALENLRDPRTSEKVVNWIVRRESMYSGSNIDHYPEILFHLGEKYGVYWGIFTPTFHKAYEHHLASGGHKQVGLIAGDDRLVSLGEGKDIPASIDGIFEYINRIMAQFPLNPGATQSPPNRRNGDNIHR